MGKLHRAIRHVTLIGVALLAATATSCTDPVKDHAIERLGPEAAGVPAGPEHRPGQPCVLCHSDGGPASDHKFAIAGTIYDTVKADRGAENVRVYFIDTANVDRQVVTNAAGNFFVREEEWPDLAFPFKTGIRRGSGLPVKMQSTINREGSCNFCHQLPGGDARESIGPIFAPGGGT
jgi:hypothetical protein